MDSTGTNGRPTRDRKGAVQQSPLPMDVWLEQDAVAREDNAQPLRRTGNATNDDAQTTPRGEWHGPRPAEVDGKIEELEAIEDDPELKARAALGTNAIAFVHFDGPSAQSNMVEALVDETELDKIDRGMYVHVVSIRDGRQYTGRVVEGPFFVPDALKRDSAPVQFIILHQGKGKVLSLPEYHGIVHIELLGEERVGRLFGATRRPHPGSPVNPYDDRLMAAMLNLHGNICLGHLDIYPEIMVRVDENDKKVMPRNWMTVGTIGGGKSNTNQVVIEETLDAGFAQIVLDPEGEFVFMDQASEMGGVAEALESYGRRPKGVRNLTVYRPQRSTSYRKDATRFTVPFDSLAPELIVELTEMNDVQRMRFMFLYDQAVQLLRKQRRDNAPFRGEDIDVARGYSGITLDLLITMLEEELDYWQWQKEKHPPKSKTKSTSSKRGRGGAAEAMDDENDEVEEAEPEFKIYCHTYSLKPLIRDHTDPSSYGALRKKLLELQRTGIFDQPNVSKLDPKELCKPGHLSVIDLSGTDDQQIINIIIADVLARVFHYKMDLSPEENAQRKVCITIEEAHGFVSREKQGKMEQTLDQLRRIARRGRKRWLTLHFVTQSPQHLPSELFELANNKIIHQTTGTENLRVLKTAAGMVNEGLWNDVPNLGVGRAIVISNQFPHPLIVQVRPAASRRYHVD